MIMGAARRGAVVVGPDHPGDHRANRQCVEDHRFSGFDVRRRGDRYRWRLAGFVVETDAVHLDCEGRLTFLIGRHEQREAGLHLLHRHVRYVVLFDHATRRYDHEAVPSEYTLRTIEALERRNGAAPFNG